MTSLVNIATLAFAISIGFSVSAFAQTPQCPADTAGDGDEFFKKSISYVVPTADERHEVEDFISRYAWLMDNRNAGGVRALFAPGSTYLLCQTGVSYEDGFAQDDEIEKKLRNWFTDLGDKRARRLFSNILIRKNTANQTYEALISSVVFTQGLSKNGEAPAVDYMASLYATIVRDSFGDPLKFGSLIVLTDQNGITIKAR
ncbi:nuclear transport factor 2 family protein [Rhizobium leguminosarum]